MKVWLCGLIGFLLIQEHLLAQCDPTLSPATRSPYKYRSYEDHCEGYYVANVNASALELVNFSQGELTFSAPNRRIQGPIPISSLSKSKDEIHLRVVGIPSDLYYRLDAITSKNTPFKWPIQTVVLPNQIQAKQLGIYGWEKIAGKYQYFPISCSGVEQGSSEASNYLIILRSSQTYDEIHWRLLSPSGKTKVKFQQLNGMRFWAGKAIEISLPSSLKGVYTLEVATRTLNQTQYKKSIFTLNI